jgi:hypothetical protein
VKAITVTRDQLFDEIISKKKDVDPFSIPDHAEIPFPEKNQIGITPFEGDKRYLPLMNASETHKHIFNGIPMFRRTTSLETAARMINFGGWVMTGMFKENDQMTYYLER